MNHYHTLIREEISYIDFVCFVFLTLQPIVVVFSQPISGL
jgi:hypothetical protein